MNTMVTEKVFENQYQLQRDMTSESEAISQPLPRRKNVSKITLSLVSIGINLVAVGMLAYALFLITHRSHKSHTYSLVKEGKDNFTPLQYMRNVEVNKLPQDASVLLKIKDSDTVTMRLYQVKSVQAQLDKNGDELYRTFFLSLGHKLVFKDATAILYDESSSNILAEYNLNEEKKIKLSEMDGAKVLDERNEDRKSLRKLFFTKEKLFAKKPYGGGYGPGQYNPYGFNGYCPYCGMYSYGNRWGGFPFGGGYPYGGMGMGMGGFGVF